MGKGGGSQTVSNRPDAATQQYIDQMRGIAMQGAAGLTGGTYVPPGASPHPGVNPNAAEFWQRAQRTFNSSPGAGTISYGGITQTPGAIQPATFGAQPGGSMFEGPITPEQIQAAMNPYIAGVIDPMRAEYDMLRGQASTGVGQAATAAGAFGGSRHGVAQGVRLGEIDRAQGAQTAGLMQQGYGQALSFAEHQRQLAERMRQEPLFRQQQALQMMNMGLGPTGGTQTSSGTAGQNPFGMALGGASVGSAFGLPGTLIGGGLGLLGGLFG